MKLLPTPVDIGRETLTIMAGAVLAAFVIGQLPALREWMRRQWAPAAVPVPSVSTF